MAGNLEESYSKPIFVNGRYDNPFPTWKQPGPLICASICLAMLIRATYPTKGHNHYDHMDYNTIVELERRYGAKLSWFVPEGNRKWMRDAGCTNVTEMTWWQEETVRQHPGITVACTPCQHWSSRTGVLDTNQSLWSSWCVIGPTERFYFAGDTGYCEAFQQIGRLYGPFSLAGIPIGAYKPRWFMRPQHVEPEESVQIHQDVQAKKSIGIHWGTFKLTHEHYLEPRAKLKEEMEKKNLSPEDFFTLKHGEIRLISNQHA